MPKAFTADEYEARWERARQAMVAAHVDGLVLTTRENVLYACGLDTYAWYNSLIAFVLPVTRPAVLVIPLGELGNAETDGISPEIRTWGDLRSGETEKVDVVCVLADTLKDRGLGRGRIAMEWQTRSGLAPETLYRLRGLLEDASVVPAEPLLAAVRRIKSPREIAYIREACRVTCRAYENGLTALQEGATEVEIARLMWEVMIRLGCDLGDHASHIILRGGPERNRCFGAVPSPKRLVRGDIVKIDGGARVHGYCCDMARYGALGEPTAVQQRMFTANVQAGEAAIAALRPGVRLGEVFAAAVQVIREHGYEALALSRPDPIFGHSVGMSVHEPPTVAAGAEEIVEPGMVFALEPQINAYPPDFKVAVFSVEDMVLVTEGGPEVLTPIPRDLRVVL